jgi:uncharacterized protein (DUF1697 family)
MPIYVALLRGISPLNPNMRNEKLRGVFEGLGFANVKTVISSGNVIFESPRRDASALEKQIEGALFAQLGFTSTTIIRTKSDLQRLIVSDPFKGAGHSQKLYLTVTFLKNQPKSYDMPEGRGYSIVGAANRTVLSIVDLTLNKTPDLMTKLERNFGKDITTRTWKTVLRILDKM